MKIINLFILPLLFSFKSRKEKRKQKKKKERKKGKVKKMKKKHEEEKHEKLQQKRAFIQDLQDQIKAKKITIAQASREHQISLSTLKRFNRPNFDLINYTGGRHSTLSAKQESLLLEWCYEQNSLGWIITPKIIREKARKVASKPDFVASPHWWSVI